MTIHAAARLAILIALADLLWAGLIYAGNWPGLLFKRPDGSRPWWTWIVLGPYFLGAWISFWMHRLTDHDAPFSQVAPGIWLSRRLSRIEARLSGVRWAAIVDLTAEFHRTPLPQTEYLCLPTLDGRPPSIEQLRQGIDWINQNKERGPVLIHCALGRGRSATLVVAWLAAELSGDLQTALDQVQKARPCVALNAHQIGRLQEMFGERQNRTVRDRI